MTTYSAFFSSGLLAGPNMYSRCNTTNSNFGGFSFPKWQGPEEPSRVIDALDDTSDIEVDRSITPTPATQPSQAHASVHPPRLRRRRSSLNVGTSPMNIIKSPSRAVGNALQLQRHLLASPGRSRSGSASSVLSIGEELSLGTTGNNVASESTSLVGRMRSGSVGSALKSRRTFRRFPGPSFPPPSAPLPPLPSIPGTPTRLSKAKAKAYSVAMSPSVGQTLAQKLASASAGDTMAISPTSMSPRQPFGDLQLHGYGFATGPDRDQEMAEL